MGKDSKTHFKEHSQHLPSTSLIPETVLDAASQRVFIVSLFVLVQAWKAYDLYVLRDDHLRKLLYTSYRFNFLSPEVSFVFKYLFLDGFIVWLNCILRIPKLSLRPIASMLILVVIYTIDFSLTLDLKLSFVGVAFPSLWKELFPDRELTIMEQYVDRDELADQSLHFKGHKTIRFAPDSSIKLNPLDDTFCLSSIYGRPIQIPISYESSNGLESLQLRYLDFNNGATLLNFTKRELNGIYSKKRSTVDYDPAASNSQVLRIPVSKPGSYSIQLALDTKGKTIRSHKSTVMIPICPEASFGPTDLSDKCVGDEVGDITINVLGVPPFTLYHEEEINGVRSHLPKAVLVPEDEDFYSPLLSKELYTGQGKKNTHARYSSSDLKDISWARSRSIEVPIGKKRIEKAGEYVYTVNRIIDGFGNVAEYTPGTSNQENTLILLKAHPKPLISLVDVRPETPILLGRDKHIDIRLSQVDNVESEAPYTVVFKFTPEQKNLEERIFTKSFDFRTPARIFTDIPGTYSIETAFSRYCSCKIGSYAVNIRQAKLPMINVTMDPIVDNCVGTTGFKFNLEFIGSAPFEVGYKISRLDPKDSTKVLSTERVSFLRSESTVLEYEFNPPSEGSYAIEFVSLNDKFYKNQIRFDKHEYRYITYFRQRPRAYFDKNFKVRKVNTCNGGTANISLVLEGKAPFNVAYNLMSPDYKVDTFTLKDVSESVVNIHTPKLTLGGEYVLSLKNVTDSSSCDVDFKGQEIHINVRGDVPQLCFASSEDYTLVQGKKLSIPLKGESDERIDLVYSYESYDHQKRELRTSFDPTEGLSVSQEGAYSLISFTQGGCPGKISDNTPINVHYLAKPTLQLLSGPELKSPASDSSAFTMNSICEDGSGSINFKASGVAPFVIRYSIKYPDGLVEEKVQQLPGSNFAIQLKTTRSGRYEYTAKGIYDSIYTTTILDQLERQNLYRFKPIEVFNTVNQLPLAHIINKEDSFQTCVSSLHNPEQLVPLKLSLSGKLPIDVKLLVMRDQDGPSEVVKLEHLETRDVNVYAMYENMGIGTFFVSVAEVKDANGCMSRDIDSANEVTVLVNDVPKIRHLIEESSVISEHGQMKLEKLDSDGAPDINFYCVGDYITYMLNGVPPFTVYYEFNGKKQEVKVNSNYFKRRAPSAGEMNILAVSDSSSKNCMVNFASEKGEKRPDLKAKIFNLPSVEIVQGESDEEDIYEGEQTDITFKLTGQAPFKLTYIRTDLSEQNKIVETEVVDNIVGNEYKITTNLEGTYEAIEIQDAYCAARNHRV
ncbi:hypothetical protein FOA43_001656 [Brettanomyces nanus]|uniref:Uncharacterized protein n=1 Tax=Eeniella nana TaxID=13502 RepID=A0A875S3F1_EENNA|nr:uncharacterized protein FOA43_001656 [Brettanomyces nanus]QPG74329.1 hypothetical protein FOA43_001656 [Brettanomyces nanus]